MVRELIVKNYFYFFTAPPVKPVANNHAGAPDECWDFPGDYDISSATIYLKAVIPAKAGIQN
jgi:hypothetical protein